MDNNNEYIRRTKGNDIQFYKNDLMYKKHRNIDMPWLIKNNHSILSTVKEDMDTLKYRMNDCIKKGGLSLDISHLELLTMPTNLPRTLKFLFCSDNLFSDLGNIEYLTELEILDCCSNRIKTLGNLPSKLVEMSCRNNKLTNIDGIKNCPKLERLDCSYNDLESIPSHNHLKIVVCNSNRLNELPSIPNLHKLSCRNNNLKQLGEYNNLEYLECNRNKIENISNYPSLKHLFCSHNNINSLSNLNKLETLHCYTNNIEIMPYFKNLKELMCDYEKVKKISKNYKIIKTCRKKKLVLILMNNS